MSNGAYNLRTPAVVEIKEIISRKLSFAIAAMAMKVAFAVLALVVCAYAIPEEDIHSALSDLTSLVQEQKSAPEVAIDEH